MPDTLRQQVEKQISKVEESQRKLLAELDAKFWKSDEVESAVNALKALSPRIKDWTANGRSAVKSDTTPGGGGWSGWIKAGEILLQGMPDIASIGQNARLENIIVTVKNIPKNVPADLKKAGQIAKKVASETASAVGGTAFSLVTPLLPILLPAVGVAVLVFFLQKKVLT